MQQIQIQQWLEVKAGGNLKSYEYCGGRVLRRDIDRLENRTGSIYIVVYRSASAAYFSKLFCLLC